MLDGSRQIAVGGEEQRQQQRADKDEVSTDGGMDGRSQGRNGVSAGPD